MRRLDSPERRSGHKSRRGDSDADRSKRSRSRGRDRCSESRRAGDAPREERRKRSRSRTPPPNADRRKSRRTVPDTPPYDTLGFKRRERWEKGADGFWSRRVHRVADNPHLHQLAQEELVVKREDDSCRVLEEDAPRLPYRRRRGERKSTVHWGQRKLLLSEIEFLTHYAEPGITVVYAGAAPGTHIPYLAGLFPGVSFVLVDPNKFNCVSSGRIVVRQEYFTHEVAKEFVGKKTLFISDIRTAQWKHMEQQEIEAAVARDMRWQREWHEIMAPVAGMHKFRLPWKAGHTEYLGGKVYLPIWGPQTTSEARLISTGGTKLWDNTAYEEQMFYFNTITRLAAYDHDVEHEGLDHCYDCAAECHVLRQYLTKYPQQWEALTAADTLVYK